ncbi:MAG: TAXI family TRAP transporter solute-binding subunit, partial [Alphaproteobacteria bacterium]
MILPDAEIGAAMLRRAALALGFFLATAALGVAASAEPQKLVLSAGKNDPALALAQQLCALINPQQKRLNIDCETRESGGGIDSLQALDGDDVHIAFARADWVRQAMAGSGPFRDRGPVRGSGRQRSGGPNEDLRALFGLQVETFVVLARAEAGVKSLAELKGKRLNIGPAGSGGRIVYERLAPALGWRVREFEMAAELGPAEQADALCRNRVDAVFYLAANPDAGVRAAAQACDTMFIPVGGREVETLDKDNAFLLRVPIPGGLYKSAPRDVPSLGIAVVATASSKTDPR